MLFPKSVVYTVQGLWYLFCILSKIDRSEDQIDSKIDTVVSSTTSRSIFESSNSGRIRRPRGGVRLYFSKSFEFGGFAYLEIKKYIHKHDITWTNIEFWQQSGI